MLLESRQCSRQVSGSALDSILVLVCENWTFFMDVINVWSRTDFENGSSFYSNSSQKYPNKKFSLKTQKFFLLSETLSELDVI